MSSLKFRVSGAIGERMSESSDKQLEKIKEECMFSYKTGYREGYNDACDQLRQGINKLIEAANEVFKKDEE